MFVSSRKESDLGNDSGATLFKQAQAGCSESLNVLMVRHAGLVGWVVRRQQLFGLVYEDALQAGRCGLWHAILGYDPGRGTTFATYAYVAIMRHVWREVKSHLRRLRRNAPLGVLVVYFYETAPDPAVLRDWDEIRQSLHELVRRLPRRLRFVVTAHYGLNGAFPMTYQQIGERMGLTRQRVQQLHVEALVWLRQPAHSQELHSLLARHTQRQYELADRLAQAWLRRRGGRNGRQ